MQVSFGSVKPEFSKPNLSHLDSSLDILMLQNHIRLVSK